MEEKLPPMVQLHKQFILRHMTKLGFKVTRGLTPESLSRHRTELGTLWQVTKGLLGPGDLESSRIRDQAGLSTPSEDSQTEQWQQR